MGGRQDDRARRWIPSAGPSITEKEVQVVAEAVRDGWYTNMTRYIEEFERQFAAYTGMRYCLATSSCTGAIHLALAALDIGQGDEVIVPDITWVASAAPVCYTGARPVLVDIDRINWCLAPEALERAITRRTKAVIVVGLLGNMPDMDALLAITERHSIPVIEDAAESIGAEYRGRRAGTFGTIGVFSFNGTKLLVTGEGGMIVTNHRRLYERFQRLSHHGIVKRPEARYYWSHELGYKYKLSNIQAALGLAQLSRIDELVTQRRLTYRWYQERLKDVEGVQLNAEAEGVKNTFWIVTAIVSRAYGMRKELLVRALEARGIGGRPFFYPLSSMPTFAPYCRGMKMRKTNPISYGISPYGICLPSAAVMTEEDVDYVCEQLKEILATGGGRRKQNRLLGGEG